MNGITYLLLPEYKLVVEKAIGKVRKSDFIEMLSTLYQMDEYVGTTSVLTDLRGVELLYLMTDMDDIANFIRETSNNPVMVHHAVLTDAPSLTAVSLIFESATVDIPDYKCMVFSTESSAAKFLEIPECVINEAVLNFQIET
jgi:hypothetical protein